MEEERELREVKRGIDIRVISAQAESEGKVK